MHHLSDPPGKCCERAKGLILTGGSILEVKSFKLDIPEGTQTGSLFRIDGQGIKHLEGQGKGGRIGYGESDDADKSD
jgi:hypothetical protein